MDTDTSTLSTQPDQITVQYATTDVLFGSRSGERLRLTTESRARAFLQLLEDVAGEEIDYEWKQLEAGPDELYEGRIPASQKERARSPEEIEGIRVAEVARRVATHVQEWQDIVSSAEVISAMRISRTNATWQTANGEVHSLAETLKDAVPENVSGSGSALQIANFVERVTEIWLNAGISPDHIAACHRVRMGRMLADISQVVNLVESSSHMFIDGVETEMTAEDRVMEHHYLCRKARTVRYGQDFLKYTKERYRKPNQPPPPSIQYELWRSRTGQIVRIIAEMSQDLYQHVFLPRLHGRIEQVRGGFVAFVTPALVSQALPLPSGNARWKVMQRKLMRAAVLASPARATCLGILEAAASNASDPDEAWIDEEYVRTASLGELTQQMIITTMRELTRYPWDGVHPFVNERPLTEAYPHGWRITYGLPVRQETP